MQELTAPHIITAAAAILGALIGGLVSVVVVCINRRFDDRRHLREIAIKSAVTYWQGQVDLAKFRSGDGSSQYVAPLDSYIVHMLLLADYVSSKCITRENIVGELSKIRSISSAASDAVWDEQKKAGKP